MKKVLIANRGEIAVRIARACADEGLTSVAVYSEPDADSFHVHMADEAYALPGSSSAETYLDIPAVLAVAERSGADAVHPGYGFLSENAEFARAVVSAGLTWIGPAADVIKALGNKVTAREIAVRAGAPLVPGTNGPVADAAEARAFAEEHGLPVALKAAFGGGGRGMRIARELDEVEGAFDAAVREATAAFGRGECFVERFLERPRHVEAQVVADSHGTVTVVGTRDCSLQRRHQKLVEEAPAPFLTDEQRTTLHESARAICREAGYTGAGTVEYLVAPDGLISFLEVNTRLQVEHPVSEEVSGLDLVREQFRIARGEALGYEDPEIRGHSFEFRINGEDAGRNFMPSPGTLTTFTMPSGPGVRVDSGVEAGETVGGSFDSMLAKLIVTGANRTQALERSRRALQELSIEGMPTVVPFHRTVVSDPAFATPEDTPFTVHTRWIETEFDNQIEPFSAAPEPSEEEPKRQSIVVEVGGKRLEVTVPQQLAGPRSAAPTAQSKQRKQRATRGSAAARGASGDSLTSPMQGTIVKIAVSNGDEVSEGDLIVVLEAMKMEQPLTAHKSGVVKDLDVSQGDTVSAGTVLASITG